MNYPAWSNLSPDAAGLVAAVVQDEQGMVRMVAYLSEESWEATLDSGLVTFWSRSRQRLWQKGEESGNVLRLLDARADCDGDTLLLTVDAEGPTCHTGSDSCFGPATHNPPSGGMGPTAEGGGRGASGDFSFLNQLWATIESRTEERPEGSYTTSLLEGGPDATGRKVVEEATEVLVAAKNHAAGVDDDQRLVEEAADLIYHLLVVLAERGIDAESINTELASRHP